MSSKLILKKLYLELDFKSPKPALSEFNKVFKHISLYENNSKQENYGNSRFVFLGMYAFKGILAEIINTYIAGNGKQLQHFLGNIYTNDKMDAIFDELNFEILAQCSPSIDIKKIKHIFTFAYLGFVCLYCKSTFTEKMAQKYFLSKLNIISNKPKNLIFVLQSKANELLGNKVKFEYFQTESGLFLTNIFTPNGQIIGFHESKSKVYSKKKAIKIAIKYLLEIESNTEKYKLFEQLSKENKNAVKQQIKVDNQVKHEAFIQEKREKRFEIKSNKQKEAIKKDIKRTLNKKNNKKTV